MNILAEMYQELCKNNPDMSIIDKEGVVVENINQLKNDDEVFLIKNGFKISTNEVIAFFGREQNLSIMIREADNKVGLKAFFYENSKYIGESEDIKIGYNVVDHSIHPLKIMFDGKEYYRFATL